MYKLSDYYGNQNNQITYRYVQFIRYIYLMLFQLMTLGDKILDYDIRKNHPYEFYDFRQECPEIVFNLFDIFI